MAFSPFRRQRRRASVSRRGRSTFELARRLRLESLEDRRLLSITVNTLLDEADGSIADGDVSGSCAGLHPWAR